MTSREPTAGSDVAIVDGGIEISRIDTMDFDEASVYSSNASGGLQRLGGGGGGRGGDGRQRYILIHSDGSSDIRATAPAENSTYKLNIATASGHNLTRGTRAPQTVRDVVCPVLVHGGVHSTVYKVISGNWRIL